MGKAKTSKIFLQDGTNIYRCLLTYIGKDGSVYIGFSSKEKFREKIICVLDRNVNYLPGKDFKVLKDTELAANSKISFHPTGSIKATTTTLIRRGSTDRATIRGIPFIEIKQHQLMCHINLSKDLQLITQEPNERDLLFDITGYTNRPLHILVSCMNYRYFCDYQKLKLIDVSVLELTLGLKYKDKIWAYTLWISSEKEEWPIISTIYIPGRISWPSLPNN